MLPANDSTSEHGITLLSIFWSFVWVKTWAAANMDNWCVSPSEKHVIRLRPAGFLNVQRYA